MENLLSILLILVALLGGAISPGPSFILVATTAIGSSRNDGIAASIGMGVGGVILSIVALTGLYAALEHVPSVYTAFKIFGGLYLAYLAIRLFKDAKQELAIETSQTKRQQSLRKAFFISLFTQLSNPKAAIVYSGIFAALLPEKVPNSFYYILPPLVFLVETLWYLVVTFVLSTPSSRAVYLRSKIVYDRLAGSIMAGLSFKLISTANNP